MKIIKITNVPGVQYQFRHWLRWYWITENGQIFRINKTIKTAKELSNE